MCIKVRVCLVRIYINLVGVGRLRGYFSGRGTVRSFRIRIYRKAGRGCGRVEYGDGVGIFVAVFGVCV